MVRSKNKRQRKKVKINQSSTYLKQTESIWRKANKILRAKEAAKLLPSPRVNNLQSNNVNSANLNKSTSTIVISPEKTKSISNINESHLDSESDCEIIEQVTPVIVVDDDDCLNESSKQTAPTTQIEASESINNTVNIICASDIDGTAISSNAPNVLNTNEITTELYSQPIEELQLFFEDKTPGTHSEAPIYELNSNNQNMAHNFRITFRNKENNLNLDNSFVPNPLLSSTRLNVSCDETEASPENAATDAVTPSQPKDLCISINSMDEGDLSRRVSVGKTSAKSPILTKCHMAQIANGSQNNGKKSNKRKASNETEEDKSPPPKRRSQNKPSDIIELNDTISDEDDSVVFVSETMDHQKRNRVSLLRRAADYISLVGDNANQNRNGSKSTRAKRKQERKKAEKERAAQANISNKMLKQQKNRIIRFTPENPNTSVNQATSASLSTSATAISTTSSMAAVNKKVILEYDKEKKLIAEKPELFEKRPIIVDGSNVAYAHGEAKGKPGLYSVKGIELCVRYFEDRGFIVRVVIPQYRMKPNQSSDVAALLRMEKAGKLIKSPCKNLPGQKSTCYDDRIVLESAELINGAVISNDNYSDLLKEKDVWDEIIKQRVIGFSWCDDFIMIPDDPYGRNGRTKQLILHKLKDDANIDDINVNGDSKSQ